MEIALKEVESSFARRIAAERGGAPFSRSSHGLPSHTARLKRSHDIQPLLDFDRTSCTESSPSELAPPGAVDGRLIGPLTASTARGSP